MSPFLSDSETGKSVFFCCLVFFVAWAFRVFFLLFGRVRVLSFAVWAGAKNMNTPPPRPSGVFAVWAGGRVVIFGVCARGRGFIFAVWAGACFVLLFGRGACFFFCCLCEGACFHFCAGSCCFCCLGGVRVCFAAFWARGVFILLLFGRGTEVHSLTGLPGSSLRGPTTKKTKQQKQNTGSNRYPIGPNTHAFID